MANMGGLSPWSNSVDVTTRIPEKCDGRCAVDSIVSKVLAWRDQLLALMPSIDLTLVIGQYAIAWHLKPGRGVSLTETVRNWHRDLPTRLPLPHPSPRNTMWLKKNPWFDAEVLPALKHRIATILDR